MDRLRKRHDFLAAAKAQRAGSASFLMQGRDRGDAGAVRIGYTVTKKTGNAVVRNRIRRRLREAVRKVLPDAGRPGHDYVLVAREAALRTPFEGLVREVERAVRKLAAPQDGRKSGARKDPSRNASGGSSGRPPARADAAGPGPHAAAPSADLTPTPADGGPRHE